MAKNLGFTKILITKAIALRDGLLTIHHPAPQNLFVTGDSKILIDAINSRIDILWRIKFLVCDIRILACRFSNIIFQHILRETNFVADSLANLGYSASPSFSSSNCLPLSSSSAFRFDQFEKQTYMQFFDKKIIMMKRNITKPELSIATCASLLQI